MVDSKKGGQTGPAAQPRVVLLARDAQALPIERRWLSAVGAGLVIWIGQEHATIARSSAMTEDRWLRRARVVGAKHRAEVQRTKATLGGVVLRNSARLRSSIIARRSGVDQQWLWALKVEQRLARDLRASDLLIVFDADSADALRTTPDLARGVPVLWPDQVPAVRHTLEVWRETVDKIGGVVARGRGALTGVEIEGLAHLNDKLVEVPRPLLGDLPEQTEVLARAVWQLGSTEAVEVIETVLLPLVTGGSPSDLERLAPARARAALSSGSWVPSDAELDQSVRGGFRRADLALASGDQELAIARFHEAMSLLLHRSRHSKIDVSPLAVEAAEFISPLSQSDVLKVLVGTGTIGGPSAPLDAVVTPGAGVTGFQGSAVGNQTGPRVLILPGSYGSFHQDLVDSLQAVAEVTAPGLTELEPLFRRGRPSFADLTVLAGLRAGEIDVPAARWRDRPDHTVTYRPQLRALRHLWEMMSGAEVVVSDWIDSGALWASQVCPAGTRLVMRAHSLDIIDPWLHLIDWRTVNEVMVSNDGFASLYRELTEGSGAPHGIVVRPHRPDLPTWSRRRTEETRFTIGMVGWGRLAKDPSWALDLLELDERRRLVLIGPGPGPVPQPFASARRAMADVEARLKQPHLRDRVTIVGPTTNVAGHLQEVGIILSSSIREGWHLGLIEGAASGAVPVVRDWPMLAGRGGATSLFPKEWVVGDLVEADARLTELADPATWRSAADRAQQQVLELFAPGPAARTYRKAVLGPFSS